MASITQAVQAIQRIAKGLPEMRAAPNYPPEQMNVFPFAVSYISAVEVPQYSHSMRNRLYTITTEIHVSLKDTPRSFQLISPYPTLLPDAIWDSWVSGGELRDLVSGINSVGATFAPSQWGGVDTIAWQFQTVVKITGATGDVQA